MIDHSPESIFPPPTNPSRPYLSKQQQTIFLTTLIVRSNQTDILSQTLNRVEKGEKKVFLARLSGKLIHENVKWSHVVNTDAQVGASELLLCKRGKYSCVIGHRVKITCDSLNTPADKRGLKRQTTSRTPFPKRPHHGTKYFVLGTIFCTSTYRKAVPTKWSAGDKLDFIQSNMSRARVELAFAKARFTVKFPAWQRGLNKIT